MMSSRTVGGEIPQRLHNGASLTFCTRRGSEALLDSPSVASGAQTLGQPYQRGSAASMPAIEDATEDVPMSTEANGGHSEAAPLSIQGVGTKAGTQAKPVSVDAAAKKVIAAMSAEKLGKAVMKKPTAKVSQVTPAVMGKINVDLSIRVAKWWRGSALARAPRIFSSTRSWAAWITRRTLPASGSQSAQVVAIEEPDVRGCHTWVWYGV